MRTRDMPHRQHQERPVQPAILLVLLGAVWLAAPETLRGQADAETPADAPFSAPGYDFPSCGLSAEGPHGTGDIRSVHVTMRDGVRIALDVVLPEPLPEGRPVPTILTMTRYWRSEEGREPGARERFYTSHGYALVVGDVRGTGASFGRWPHHRSEAETRDFPEIIDWIVEQPWSDGRVAGLGSSYAANTADWMSVRGHPALKAVVSRFPDFDPYADLYFPGGVPNAYMGREWMREVKAMDLNVKREYEDGPRGVRPVDGDRDGRLLARAIEARRDVPSVWEGLRTVTYRDDEPPTWDGASVDDWGTHGRTEEIEEWSGPIRSWGSWMDAGTANGVLHRFMTLDNPQSAFIGAWSHGGWEDADPFRPADAEARPPAELQFVEDLCFLERQLDEAPPSEADRRLVYYTMGEGRWKTTTEWPPPEVGARRWYFAEEGRLTPSAPAAGASDEYVVDPTATTGTTNRWATNATGGDVVYGDRARADDKLLTYTSAPLPAPLEITGQPVVNLYASSTHEDGAFFAYLEAVAPDGTVRYLTEGMLRGLHRTVSEGEPPYRTNSPYHTFERADAAPMVPGRISSLAFGLMPTSVLVPAGHRLRIAIAGADADTFRPVPDTDEGTPTLGIHRGGAHASHVVLPVVPRLPTAESNDHRTPAGRMVDGELVLELEAVEAAWYPRGPDGPRIVTPAFREVGRAPQVPGPLIRAPVGTPVRVTVRNALDRAITVRGLVDRTRLESSEDLPEGADPSDPRFFLADSLVVPPGATRDTRFTPTSEVSSFYYGRRAPPEGGSVGNPFLPGSFGDEGAFLGGVVVDPADVAHPPDERVMLISRWGGREEPSTLTTTFKMMINGRSWPHTERLRYAAGDTVRWRVINTSVIEHPMHLHGFYFRIDARGDADADTVYAPADRPLAVTDLMPDFSSLRLSWVPDRPGNWLFHCHLIRHMGSAQRFAGEGPLGTMGSEMGGAMDGMDGMDAMDGMDGMDTMDGMDAMVGLVMGITVDPDPASGDATREPPPRRTLHLWTARTPGVFGEQPALSFVARQDGSEPPADTLVAPGTPLVLQRGEPTDIVVHNRLGHPLSVHWHGLEVRSAYDGVAHWSGHPGATRPPVAPGNSATVRITPPRAGTFIYHIHGEPGQELSQGLYGPFLVLPEGEAWDRERDRVFVLAARGAERDPPPVVNGRESAPPERFEPGRTYRLRLIHISPDAFEKRVRLLRDGEPVAWRPRAKDGADLPDAARDPEPAAVALGVGETFDAEWTPREPGAYTLEVVTTHYSASGLPPTVQRVALGVGNVTEEALAAAARVEPPPPPPPSPLDTVPAAELEEDELRRLVGTWTAPGAPVDFVVEWQEGGLVMSVTGREPRPLVPLSPTVFRWEDEPSVAVELETEAGGPVLVVFGMRLRPGGDP